MPALIGAIIGAQIAVDMSDILFRGVLAFIMLLILRLILWNPRRDVGSMMSSGRNHLIITMIAFFLLDSMAGLFRLVLVL